MATYYVRQSGGSDSNDGLSFANGWATIQKAADTAVAGDLVLICADGTYTPSVTINFNTNKHSGDDPIIFRGAASDGTDDGTQATISGSSLGASDDLIDLSISGGGVNRFENLRFTGATQYNIYKSTSAANVIILKNCRVDNASSHGIYFGNPSDLLEIYDTEIDSNGGAGVTGFSSTSRANVTAIRSCIHDNSGNGVEVGQRFRFIDCLIYDNGDCGIYIAASSGTGTRSHYIVNCVFFNNTNHGVKTNGGDCWYRISNCIFRSNGGYAINSQTGQILSFSCENICSHNNTSGHIDINGGTLPGSGHVLEDPGFASETDGSEDFTPSNTNLSISKAFAAGGTTYFYIGAIQPQATSGGTGERSSVVFT